MATGITAVPLSDTPYSKCLSITPDDGNPGLFSIDDFAAALSTYRGPLLETLLGEDPLHIDRFNVNGIRGSEIRIYLLPTIGALNRVDMARTIVWVAGATTALAGLQITLPAAGEDVGALTIEVRLNHSTQG